MAKKFLTAIDLTKNELQNAVVQNLASAPATPLKGQMYFNSTGGDNTLYWYDGAGWIAAKPPSTSGITQAEADTRYVNVAGDTMTGDLSLPSSVLTVASGVFTTLNTEDATVTNAPGGTTSVANKQYVDTQRDSRVPTARLINTTVPLTGGGALSGDLTLAISAATETAVGAVELATVAEANAGADTTRAVTPAGLVGRVLRTGDSMTGLLVLSADPAVPLGAATKQYVDTLTNVTTLDARYINTNGDTLTGFLTLNADPTNGLHAASKQYVDNAIAGLSWADTVRAATTTNLTLSGLQTVDGVVLGSNDRVLVKNQSALNQNGLYLAQSGAWTRTTDADSEADLLNIAVFVSEGTTQADTAWVGTANAPITVGTTNLPFTQFAGTGGSVPPNRLINTTAPLAGGGDLSVDRTLSVANATTGAVGVVALATTAEATAQTDNNKAVTSLGLADRVKTSLTLTGTAPIAIEGVHTAQTLAANRTISILAASTTVVGASRLATTAEATAQSLATVAVTPAGLADRVLTSRTISTTAPLTGGGALTGNLTFDISTFTTAVKGAVPPPGTVTGKFLKDDGTWAVAGQVAKFTQGTIGGSTAQVVTHNLNSQSVVVNVYRTLTPWDTVECDVERTTVNTVTLRFAVAPAANEYSVVVVG